MLGAAAAAAADDDAISDGILVLARLGRRAVLGVEF